MKVSVVVPVREGSERVLRKNTRTFAGVDGGLTMIKLAQLTQCSNIDEIILTTNCPDAMRVGKIFSSVKVIERADFLCASDTSTHDLNKHIASLCKHSHTMVAHVTCPMVKAKDYDEIIRMYANKLGSTHYDSLLTAKPLQNFLFDESGKWLNWVGDPKAAWPRTQDLKKLYEINHVVYLASRNSFSLGHRHGQYPFMYEMSRLKSIDIDCGEDFDIAEAVYQRAIGTDMPAY